MGTFFPWAWLLDCHPQEEIILLKPNNANILSDDKYHVRAL